MNKDLKQLARLHDENIQLTIEIERLKGERRWIKIDPNETDAIPNENVWTYWFKTNQVVLIDRGEFIPHGNVSHYMLLTYPSPPKQ